MPDQIDEELKEQWRDEVMALQQEVSLDKSAEMVGKVIEVMIEGKISDDDAYVGRSYKDAPNVDGYVFVNTTASLMSGDIVKVRITGAMEYDLIGEYENEFTE
jgi:ribosomal protein S12 methylthiotransferase